MSEDAMQVKEIHPDGQANERFHTDDVIFGYSLECDLVQSREVCIEKPQYSLEGPQIVEEPCYAQPHKRSVYF